MRHPENNALDDRKYESIDESALPVVAGTDPTVEVSEIAEHARHARDVGLGTLCCLTSAVLYTCTNACLRVVVNHDPYWVSCLKALPTMLLAGAILAYDRTRGVRHPLSLPLAIGLFFTGVLAHFGGNVAFQWGLEIVGLAATVPLTFSLLLITGALLGRFWLGEPITQRTIAAIAFLSAAFLCVSLHTREAAGHVGFGQTVHPTSTVILAVAAVCFSGIAYAVLGAVIRRTVTGAASMSSALFVIGLAGIVTLGPAAVARVGIGTLTAISPRDYGIMFGAGAFNAVAFFALTRAMQLVPVSFVNIVNASQVAMAAIAGVVLFHEAVSPWLYGGIALTVAGLVTNRRPRRKR